MELQRQRVKPHGAKTSLCSYESSETHTNHPRFNGQPTKVCYSCFTAPNFRIRSRSSTPRGMSTGTGSESWSSCTADEVQRTGSRHANLRGRKVGRLAAPHSVC